MFPGSSPVELDKPWEKKKRMETLVPCVGTSPRCSGALSGSSLPPAPAQTSLVSDKVKESLTKMALEGLHQDDPTFQKLIVCLQWLFPSALRASGELQESFMARRWIPQHLESLQWGAARTQDAAQPL